MKNDKAHRGRRPKIVSPHGTWRFQTGLVTARLVRRGVEAEVARRLAKSLRDQVAGMSELTASDLDARVDVLVQAHGRVSRQLPPLPDAASLPLVITSTGVRPFRRGLLLRDLFGSGLDMEPALSLAQDLLAELRDAGQRQIGEEDLHDRVADRISDQHGTDLAQRYRLARWLRRAEEPVVLFIGGSTGTGKSTLALELAFRLGIRLVTGTDMIRETMRAVLSPEVVPGLHDHSFRGMVQGGHVLSNPRERVLAGFRQQAAQVSVGIRAVVRRALRERAHLIVEGTHLVPPFEQYVPTGGGVRVAGLMLAVPRESEHRARFPARASRAHARDAGAYLESFQAVRWVHDDLLAEAEDAECLVVESSEEQALIGTVVTWLSQCLPVRDVSPPAPDRSGEDHSTLFLIMDGLADEPLEVLGGLTPLEAAPTPVLDSLAGVGGLGQVTTSPAEGQAASTDEGMWALLGVGPHRPSRRGLYEALGAGVPLPADSVVLRGNLATFDPLGGVIDRRAGRIRAGVQDLLVGMRDVPLNGGLRGSVHPAHEHRVVVVLSGPGLSEEVSDTDPGDDLLVGAAHPARPLDDSPEAARTAEALNQLLGIVREQLARHPRNLERIEHGLLPANGLLTRGAARVIPVSERWRIQGPAALVSACTATLGIGRFAGMAVVRRPGMTGNLDTDLSSKFEAAGELLETYPLVVVHVKGTDIAAHDQRPLAKRDLIARVDEALGAFLRAWPEDQDLRVVVSCDHGTSSRTGRHLVDDVPLMLAHWPADDEEGRFSEAAAAQGAVGLLRPGELSELLWMGTDRAGRAR